MFLTSKLRGMSQLLCFDNYLQLLLTRLLFRGTSLVVYRKRGCEFLVDQNAGDVNGIRTVLTTSEYSQFFRQLGRLKNKPLNVLDMGSHVGGFPILLHLNGFKIKRLSCVELNPETYVRMCFNINNNLKCEFVPVQAAVCGERRQCVVHLGKGSTSDSIYALEYSRGASSNLSSDTVEGWTLDDLSQRAFPNNDVIDIWKIDVEGAEFEIFFGAAHASIRRCAYLIMEIHPHVSHPATTIIDRLASYKIVLLANDKLVYLFRNEGLPGENSSAG